MQRLEIIDRAPLPGNAPHARALEDLARALGREAEMIRALRDALIEQRAAVGSAEADAVNASVDAVGRILLALDEARIHRGALLSGIAGDPAFPLDRLADVPGLALPPGWTAAREALHRAATDVAHEVAINRAVLHRAIENGEAFLQALFTAAADPTAVYGATDRAEDLPPAVILNRRA